MVICRRFPEGANLIALVPIQDCLLCEQIPVPVFNVIHFVVLKHGTKLFFSKAGNPLHLFNRFEQRHELVIWQLNHLLGDSMIDFEKTAADYFKDSIAEIFST